MRFEFPSALVLPWSHLRLAFHGGVHVAMVDQVQDQVLRGRKHVRTDGATVGCHTVAVFRIRSRMVRPDVLAQHHTLIKRPGTDGAGVRLLTGVDPLVFPQGAAIGECFPTESTTVRPLAGVDADVDLLRATRSECLAALPARELSAGHAAVTVPVVHQ